MRKTIIFLTLVATLFSCTNVAKKDDAKQKRFIGKVKSINSSFYEVNEKFGEYTSVLKYKKLDTYDEKGNIINEEEYDEYDKLKSRIKRKFDKRDNEIEYIRFNKNDISRRTVGKFDENGYEVESIWYHGNGEIELKWILKNDNNGNKVERTRFDKLGNIKFKEINKFDDKGNLIESKRYDSDGSLSSLNIMEYNDKNLVKSTETDSNGNIENLQEYKYSFNDNLKESKYTSYKDGLEEVYIQKYNIKNQKVEVISYDENNKIKMKRNFNYGENDFIVYEKNLFVFQGKEIVKELTFNYFFDEIGNWVKKEEFENNVYKIYTRREIEYYD